MHSWLAHVAALGYLLPSFFHEKVKALLKIAECEHTQILTSHSQEGVMDSIGVPSQNEELIGTENVHQKPIVGSNVKIFWEQKT